MLIYHYDRSNGVFLGADEADESPLEEGVFLIPANATDIAPPKTDFNNIAVFNGEEWILAPIEDRRNVFERAWRDKELQRADIELNKVQDGMAGLPVSSWRKYRIVLRTWPEHEKFPDAQYRPVAPDKSTE